MSFNMSSPRHRKGRIGAITYSKNFHKTNILKDFSLNKYIQRVLIK